MKFAGAIAFCATCSFAFSMKGAETRFGVISPRFGAQFGTMPTMNAHDKADVGRLVEKLTSGLHSIFEMAQALQPQSEETVRDGPPDVKTFAENEKLMSSAEGLALALEKLQAKAEAMDALVPELLGALNECLTTTTTVINTK